MGERFPRRERVAASLDGQIDGLFVGADHLGQYVAIRRVLDRERSLLLSRLDVAVLDLGREDALVLGSYPRLATQGSNERPSNSFDQSVSQPAGRPVNGAYLDGRFAVHDWLVGEIIERLDNVGHGRGGRGHFATVGVSMR